MNAEHEYKTDQSGYGVGEQWEIMGPGDTGDCEDFALTKMQALIDAGFEAKNLQIAWGQTETGGNHAFLLIQTSNRGTLVLDNRFANVMQIEKVPYRFQGYQRAGQAWAGYSAKLTAVTIEYMNCHSSAFADEDDVIVKFVGQDWDSPKVIGFKENPAACTVRILLKGTPYPDIYLYNPNDDSYSAMTDYPDSYYGYQVAFANSSGTVCFSCGGSYEGELTDAVYALDILADSWESKQSLLIQWTGASALSIDTTGYMIGGASGGDSLSRFDSYDMVADSWSAGPSDFITEYRDGGKFTIGEKIQIAGGLNGVFGGRTANNEIREYDPDLNTWSLKKTLFDEWLAIGSFQTELYGYLTGGATGTQRDGKEAIDYAGVDLYFNIRTYSWDRDANTLTQRESLLTGSSTQSPINPKGAGDHTNGHMIGGLFANQNINVKYDADFDTWQYVSNLPSSFYPSFGFAEPVT